MAQADDTVELMGLDHPLMSKLLRRWREHPAEGLGVSVACTELPRGVVLTCWFVQAFGHGLESSTYVVPIAVDYSGQRAPSVEKRDVDVFAGHPSLPAITTERREQILRDFIEPTLQRELKHRQLMTARGGYAAELLAWIENA